MKSAYLVAQGYANICKMVSRVIIHVPIFRDASNCYPYHFLEICIPLCNDPVRLIQKGHLNFIIAYGYGAMVVCITASPTSSTPPCEKANGKP